MKKIHNFLLHTSRVKFTISVIFLSLGINIMLPSMISLWAMDSSVLDHPIMEEDISTFELFFLSVLLAPIFETLIFQVLLIQVPFKYIMKKNKTNYIIFGLLSALLFGIAHCYNIYYILATFGMGLYLSYVTVMTAFLREKKVSVWITVCGAHMFLNLMAFLL